MTISTPTQITVNWASGGDKNSIPIPSQTGGVASFTTGFPPLTMTPKASGGVPPSGKDMNGILFSLSQAIQYEQSGGHFPYSSSFASAVGGYPLSAIVQATDNSGFWINSTANNTTDPEAFGAGWQPLKQAGVTSLTVSSVNVTLTALQAGKDVILINGSLTQNINIIVPTWVKTWSIINNAALGAYSITVKTASGTGAILLAGANSVTGDGTNVLSLTYLLATKVYADTSSTTAANNVAIGVGQTWQDVSSSRSFGTTYTNNTGKPIAVSIDMGDSGGSGTQALFYVNSVLFATIYAKTNESRGYINVIIPNGITYNLTIQAGTATKHWFELSA